MSFVNLSKSAAVDRLGAIHARMEALGRKHRLGASDQTEFDQLGDEFDDLARHVKRIESAEKITAGLRDGTARRESEVSPGVAAAAAPATLRDQAMQTLDAHVRAGALPAEGAEAVEHLIGAAATGPQGLTARWAAATGAPAYVRAFAKLVANPTHGHLEWAADEAGAYRRVAAVQAEQRAMGIASGGAGHYLVPLTLDPSVTITNNGSINPLRQISRVVQTTTDTWQGVTSAGVTAEWLGEGVEAADAAPSLDGPSIPVHKGAAFIPFSFEIEGDAIGFMGELGKLLIDGAEQLSAAAFTNGAGTTEPKGIVTALAAASPSVTVPPDTAETLQPIDIYNVQAALPPRFQANATWTANLGIANLLRQLETSNGALKFPELSANPPALLGKPYYENSNMVAKLDPAANDPGRILLYGDFSQFVIVDRIGTSIELIPHLFSSSHLRPTGQRGALLWFRTGSDVVAPNAFRLLAIPTTE